MFTFELPPLLLPPYFSNLSLSIIIIHGCQVSSAEFSSNIKEKKTTGEDVFVPPILLCILIVFIFSFLSSFLFYYSVPSPFLSRFVFKGLPHPLNIMLRNTSCTPMKTSCMTLPPHHTTHTSSFYDPKRLLLPWYTDRVLFCSVLFCSVLLVTRLQRSHCTRRAVRIM